MFAEAGDSCRARQEPVIRPPVLSYLRAFHPASPNLSFFHDKGLSSFPFHSKNQVLGPSEGVKVQSSYSCFIEHGSRHGTYQVRS